MPRPLGRSREKYDLHPTSSLSSRFRPLICPRCDKLAGQIGNNEWFCKDCGLELHADGLGGITAYHVTDDGRLQRIAL